MENNLLKIQGDNLRKALKFDDERGIQAGIGNAGGGFTPHVAFVIAKDEKEIYTANDVVVMRSRDFARRNQAGEITGGYLLAQKNKRNKVLQLSPESLKTLLNGMSVGGDLIGAYGENAKRKAQEFENLKAELEAERASKKHTQTKKTTTEGGAK
jgi:hypothetical protein